MFSLGSLSPFLLPALLTKVTLDILGEVVKFFIDSREGATQHKTGRASPR